jgi:hypothetical protein
MRAAAVNQKIRPKAKKIPRVETVLRTVSGSRKAA